MTTAPLRAVPETNLHPPARASATEVRPITENERKPATVAEWQEERSKTTRVAAISSLIGYFYIPILGVVALVLTMSVTSGDAVYPVLAGWLAVISAPVTFILIRANVRQQLRSEEVVAALAQQSAEAEASANLGVAQREIEAQRQEFGRRLAKALEMAETEGEVMDVVERSFHFTLPGAPVELLLADNSRAHLLRVARSPGDRGAPGCQVASPDGCPAARRAQVQHFLNSEDLDACPKLRQRPEGATAALCVPVSIMGRTVGVIHATSEPGSVYLPSKVEDLSTLANLTGSRIGLLKMMADTQLQASTDGLTGLMNRRSFEEKVTGVQLQQSPMAFAMADLDHFKEINDTYGHQTGDRALRLFAEVLRSSLRSHDLVCRHGGEEFVVAFPDCTAEKARRPLETVRTRLDAAITVAGLPHFTVSIGLIDAGDHDDLPALLARSDSALFAAKHAGRDRVVVHDAQGDSVADTSGPHELWILDQQAVERLQAQ